MNNLPRQILCELILKDRFLYNDVPRCKNTLKELCINQQHSLEVNLLASALEANVPNYLLEEKNNGIQSKIFLPKLIKQLVTTKGLSEDNAQWAVESWALALKVISNAESKIPVSVTAAGTGGSSAGATGNPGGNGTSTESSPVSSTSSTGGLSSMPSTVPSTTPISPYPSSIRLKKTLFTLLFTCSIVVLVGSVGTLLYFSPQIDPLCQMLNNCSKEREYKERYEQAIKNAKIAVVRAEDAKKFEDLKDDYDLLNQSITSISTIPREAKIYPDVQKALEDYRPKLEGIEKRLNKEAEAQKLIEEAEKIAKEATKLTGNAKTIPEFEEAKTQWQKALEKLKAITPDSLFAEEAKERTDIYNTELISIDKKIIKIKDAERPASSPTSSERPASFPTSSERPRPASSPTSSERPRPASSPTSSERPRPASSPTSSERPPDPTLLPCDIVFFGKCKP